MKTIILILLISTQISLSQWKKLNAPQKITNVQNIQVFQGVFYANKSDKLYKSNDEGQTWEEISTNLKDFETFKHIYKFHIYDGVFYALSAQQLNTIYESDLYISNDLGVNWEKIKIGSNQLDYFVKIENNFYIYSPKSPRGILTSEDAKNWEKVDIDEEEQSGLIKYNKLFKTNDTIIVYQYGTNSIDGNPKYNLIKISADNGKTWVTKGGTLPNLGVKYLEKIGNSLIAGTRSGVYISNDFGDTWLLSNGVLPEESRFINEMLAVDNIIYYGAPKGFWKTLDLGKTWELVHNSLSNTGFDYLVLQDGYFFIYIYSVVNSIQQTLISKDNFNTYMSLNFTSNLPISNFYNDESGYYGTNEGIYTFDNNTNSFELVSDFFKLKSHPVTKLHKKENVLIAHYGGTSGGVNFTIISTDYGITWELIDYKKPNKINFIGYYINPDNRIFTITQNFGILYSDDLGKTWEEIEIDENTKIRLASMKSLNTKGNYFVENDSIFLYSTGIIYKTDQNFSELTDIINRQDTSLLGIFLNKDINYFAKNENFIVISNSSDNYLYFSNDYGTSWERCNFDFELNKDTLISKLIHDIVNVDSNLIVSSYYGIYLSTDYGKNWTDMRYNISNSLEGTKYLYRFKNKLYLSMSRGFYELDLKELGIASVENRNILYHYPPFPQPSTTSVNIKTFWDAGVINFTEEDIEIYNLNGEKLITKDKIKINKEAQNIGTITWDNSGVEPGIYIMKTKHGTETLITKIMVVK